jgi:hypothetical protein
MLLFSTLDITIPPSYYSRKYAYQFPVFLTVEF